MIYFVQGLVTGRVKIGFTAEIRQRVKALRHGTSEPIELLGVLSGNMDTERQLHTLLGDKRVHGEWFDLGANPLQVLAEHGLIPVHEIPIETPAVERVKRKTPQECRCGYHSKHSQDKSSHPIAIRFGPRWAICVECKEWIMRALKRPETSGAKEAEPICVRIRASELPAQSASAC